MVVWWSMEEHREQIKFEKVTVKSEQVKAERRTVLRDVRV